MTNENLPTTIDLNDKKMIATLKSTVAQGLTDEEFAVFAQFVSSTKLNPFKKEVWAIKAGGRLQIMTGINGYWSIANSNPQFDGAETGMINKTGEWVKSVPGADFIGAWCKVYRKDRKIPMEAEAMLTDYRKTSPLWQNSPRIMIKKVAQSIALRQAFPQELNGSVTEEEMPREYTIIPDNTVKQETIVAPQAVIAADPVRYAIPDITREQELYLEKRGAHKDADGVWIAPTDLGPKLAKYREMVGKPKVEASVRAESSNAWMEPTEEQLEAAFKTAKGE